VSSIGHIFSERFQQHYAEPFYLLAFGTAMKSNLCYYC
jgi:hypothetical protein